MKQYLFLTASLLTLPLSNVGADNVPKTVQSEVDEILKRHALPGGVAAIVENGKASFKVASGVRKHGEAQAFTNKDKVHIGSCGKAMTATLAGILIDEGKLTWHTRIIDVVPEMAEQFHEEYRPVTISHLLSHYAGTGQREWRKLRGRVDAGTTTHHDPTGILSEA
ncbi:MAG: serine hydrolase domain-containing protein [Planctomycetaceae bacterium]